MLYVEIWLQRRQSDNYIKPQLDSNKLVPNTVPNIVYETKPFIPQNVQMESGVSTRGVIGDDDRRRVFDTTKYPGSAILYLSITWPNGTYSRGSGFMVNERQAVTAGHCVYNAARGGWAEAIIVTPGANENKSPFGATWVLNMDVGGLSNATEADWGVLTLGGSFDSFPGCLGVRYTTKNLAGVHVTTRGYPGGYRLLYTTSGYIFEDANNVLVHFLDTEQGQSGSPMYTSDHIAVGIATKELKNSSTGVYVRNYATKISERLFVLIGGKINGGGYFSDGEDFTDGDPGFTDGGDPGFTDGN